MTRSEEPAKVDLETPDIAGIKRAAFEELFPGVLADGVLDAGRLGELLDMPVTTPPEGRERFGLMWAGKQDAVRSLLTPSRGTLVPEFDKSVDFDTARNVFIEGDGLEVLRLMQKAYNDTVDVIYIDPPYNTGNDFIYADDFSDGLRRYLEFSGQIGDDGNRLSSDGESLGRKHSRWLTMMYPRLILARNLLRQDGVIFVSIDDNEIHHLKCLMDEVFGEENLLAILAVELSKTQGMKVAAAQNGQIVKNHEYILVYSRNYSMALTDRRPLYDASELYDDHYDIIWEGGKTTVYLFKVLAADRRSAALFEKYGLSYSKSDLRRLLALDAAYYDYFIATYAARLYRESPISLGSIQALDVEAGVVVEYGKYLLRRNSKGTVVQLQPFSDGVRETDDYQRVRARATIRGALWKGFHSDMMNVGKEGGVEFKNGKKPVRLIRQLLKWSNRPEGLVLDFFAGSGTTAHAVASLNQEDSGTRRCILVQIPEEVTGGEFATVSEITRKRLANVMEAYPAEPGLRSFRLGQSSFESEDERDAATLFDLRVSTLRRARPDLSEVAAEVLLKEGVSLDAPWSRATVGGADVVAAHGVAVVLTLDVTDEVALAAFDLNPRVVVFLEDGFAGKDAVKANAFTNAKNLGITMKTV